jgi:hypothetical protein
MKPGKNFVIEFSTSAYELAKMEISKIIETPEFNATYNIRAQHSLDLSDITVDTCMKVFNRKQNGAPGSQLKYTMNFYHTTNTMTVNGWRVDIFINEIFDQLCKAIQDKCSTLNIMNTTLATQISSLQTSTSTVVQQSIDNTNKQQATTTISSPQNCHVSVSRSCRAVSDTSLVTTKPQSIQQQQSIKGSVNLSDFCPHCTQYVQDGIACDKCDAWFHYKCVGLTEEAGRARMAKTDYTFVVSVTFVRMICYIWTEAA